MQITVRLDQRAVRRIQRRFGSLRNLRWLDKPIRDSLWYMISSINRNFAVEGRPTRWRPWSPSYQLYRERVGYPMKILQLAGKADPRTRGGGAQGKTYNLQLKRSVSVGNIKRWGWIIGTNLSYARVQQEGGPVGTYGQSVLPPRPYLLFQPQDILIIQQVFNAYIRRLAA